MAERVRPPAVGAKKEECVRQRIPLSWAALVVLVLVIGSAQGALAATHSVGGNDLSDWGVVPTVSVGQFVGTSLNATIALASSVNPGANNVYREPNGGGEDYDIESLYIDADNDNIYFASIISTNPNGVAFGSYTMRQGDLAIWQGPKGAGNYPAVAPQYGVGVRKTGAHEGRVVQGASWTMDDGFVGPAYMLADGTDLGAASVSVASLGMNDNGGKANWVVKGSFARSLFNPVGQYTFKFGPSCNNDYEVLTATIPQRVKPPVPEPTTVALLAIGALPVLPMLRRRRAA